MSSINRTDGSPVRPRYEEVAEELVRRIQGGDYPVGSFLPTEGVLRETFGVSRFTVRHALRKLQEKGLVSPKHGVGTRIERAEVSERYLMSLGSVSDLSNFTRSTPFEVLRQELIDPAEASLPLPEVAPGEKWLLIEGLRFTRRRSPPIAITHIHIHPAFAGVASRVAGTKGAIFALVEEQYGERVASVRQEITAIEVPPQLVKILRVRPRSPVLRIVRHYLTASGATIEVSNNFTVSSRFVYSADIIAR